MSEFAHKVVAVTGGSMGIGAAVVERLLRGGASVGFCAVDGTSVDEAQQRMESLGSVVGLVADVRDANAMRSFIESVLERFGRLDGLANCAGVQRYGTVVDTEEHVWDEVIDINLKGAFLASKFAVPHMRRRGGSIVNVSSVQGHASQSGVAAYTASKGGILALTRGMALDHASEGIRVNSVSPGAVDTPMLRWAADLFADDVEAAELVQAWGAAHPLGRVGQPEEVAEVIAFLLGPRSTFVTGADVRVDGGVLAKLGIVLPGDSRDGTEA